MLEFPLYPHQILETSGNMLMLKPDPTLGDVRIETEPQTRNV